MSIASDEARPEQAPWSADGIRAVFERRLHARPQLSGTAPRLDVLRAAVMRPEFEPFRSSLRVRVRSDRDLAWLLAADDTLEFGALAVTNQTVAAFHLRFAAELMCLGHGEAAADLSKADRDRVAWLLALHVALSYYLQMTRAERADARAGATGALAGVLATTEACNLLALGPSQRCALLQELLTSIGQEGAIPGLPIPGVPLGPLARERAANCLAVAHPAERLLTLGGDDRLLVDPDTGLNGYGCSPRPRPWAITFSSSTASSISEQAFGEVEAMRRQALSAGLAGGLDAHLARLGDETRRAIGASLGLDAQAAEIVLTASGTDAELIALWLAMGRAPDSAIVNVLVAPEEIGSGSVPAASGRHFNPLSPHGGAVRPGGLVAGFPDGRIRVEMLPIRDGAGEPLAPGIMRESVRAVVAQAVHAGEIVLLHMVDCSKTGLMAPDLGTVEELAGGFPQHVIVVVDAAQMRLSRAMLRQYVEGGYIVLATGSKFFTGPPFSGALVIPRRTLAALPALVALPAGLAAYATAGDFPESFGTRAHALPRGCNVGLLARWRAALWEMAAFEAVPPAERTATLAAFEAALDDAFQRLPELELLATPSRERRPPAGWDERPGIFTFLLRPAAAGEPIGYEDGRRVYRWLNEDISARLAGNASVDERTIASRCCHTPQPVKLERGDGRPPIAGLRIAAGARLVSGVHFDPALGPSPAARLRAELRDMEIVLRKAALIGRRWDDFAGDAIRRAY